MTPVVLTTRVGFYCKTFDTNQSGISVQFECQNQAKEVSEGNWTGVVKDEEKV